MMMMMVVVMMKKKKKNDDIGYTCTFAIRDKIKRLRHTN
jgi:hypothetical protein